MGDENFIIQDFAARLSSWSDQCGLQQDKDRPACAPLPKRRSSAALQNAVALLALFICLSTPALLARTITLKPEALDAFVALSESNQMNGWACYNYDYTRYTADTPGGGPATSYLLR